MYGVIHGGIDRRLRQKSAEYITSLPFDGYAIGGSVGKDRTEMLAMLRNLMPLLLSSSTGATTSSSSLSSPHALPIHLLGIADVPSLYECIPLGIDTFDSCYPTRAARHGTIFSSTRGTLHIAQGKYARMHGPLDDKCACPACQDHSIAYMHHLFKAHEPTSIMLATLHNVDFMLRWMRQCRVDILNGRI